VKHDWERVWGTNHPFHMLAGHVRRCKNCGCYQNLEEVSYDRMDGATYHWRPLVGRCKPKERKQHGPHTERQIGSS
jgi:hypothetical protein